MEWTGGAEEDDEGKLARMRWMAFRVMGWALTSSSWDEEGGDGDAGGPWLATSMGPPSLLMT